MYCQHTGLWTVFLYYLDINEIVTFIRLIVLIASICVFKHVKSENCIFIIAVVLMVLFCAWYDICTASALAL